MTIEQHLVQLLFRFDCVIIPGVGGFVANPGSAFIDQDQQLVFPPFKSIIFNKNLTTNDGLLVDAVAREEKIRYEEAQTLVERFSQELRNTLEYSRRFDLTDLGILYLDEEKNIQFRPNTGSNLRMDSFGLYPVGIHPLVEEVQEKKKIIPLQTVVESEKELRTPVVEEKKRNPLRYAAAAVLLPIAFYSLWIPLRTDFLQTGKLSWTDLNPFQSGNSEYISLSKRSIPEFLLKEKVQLSVGDSSSYVVLQFEEGLDGYAVVAPYQKPAAESTLIHQSQIVAETGNIHVIGGCFKDPVNAENQVKTLQASGFPAHLLDVRNGLHRVAVASHARQEDALSTLQKVKENGISGAWILRK